MVVVVEVIMSVSLLGREDVFFSDDDRAEPTPNGFRHVNSYSR